MTTSEQLLIEATLTIAKLQAWLEAQNQREIYYLNGDVAWADEAAVLAGIPEDKRSIYQMVNIAGVDYWFTGDPLTLTPYVEGLSIGDGTITLAKLANITGISVLGRSTATTGVPQVISIADLSTLLSIPDAVAIAAAIALKVTAVEGYSLVSNSAIALIHAAHSDDQDLSGLVVKADGYSLILDTEITRLSTVIGPQQILLSASSDVATRISGGATIPSGWSVAADSGVNLLITHTLTGRKIVDVKVFEIDGDNERMIKPFEDAYSGILANGLTVKLEGLDTVALPLRIELIFD